MSLRTVILVAVGGTLSAAAVAAGYVMVVAEEAPPVGVAVFFGGLLAGGGSLALAMFRIWTGRADGWPDIAQATVLFLIGMVLTVGASGSCHFAGDTLGWVPLAVFCVGVAFTIGAMSLLAWAIRVDARR
jgi:hypothetical protein